MPSGKVKWFDQKKGYGFIKEQDTDRDIFLHISALEKSKLRILKEDQKLIFDIKKDKNRLKAINLKNVIEWNFFLISILFYLPMSVLLYNLKK